MNQATSIPDTVTIHVPFRVVKRGGRKEMQMPDRVRPERTPDSTLLKALARAFRWRRMLESGEFANIAELAVHERIAAPYMTRILRLSFLAPDLVEAILEGHQPNTLSLETMRKPLPTEWFEQKRLLSLDD